MGDVIEKDRGGGWYRRDVCLRYVPGAPDSATIDDLAHAYILAYGAFYRLPGLRFFRHSSRVRKTRFLRFPIWQVKESLEGWDNVLLLLFLY